MKRQAPISHTETDYIGGINPVQEALKSGASRIQKIYLARGAHGRANEIKDLARQRKIPVTLKEKHDLDRMAPGLLHQGVLALVAPVRLLSLEELLKRLDRQREAPFLLLLDQIVDPQNLGGLIRTAHVAGAAGVVMLHRRSSPVTSAVVKSSAGAVEHIPLAVVENLAGAIDALKEEGFWVMGADDSATLTVYDVDFTIAAAVVIGNEGSGIRPLVKKKCDILFKIPSQGKIASLNAAAAGAVALFEVVRQRLARKE